MVKIMVIGDNQILMEIWRIMTYRIKTRINFNNLFFGTIIGYFIIVVILNALLEPQKYFFAFYLDDPARVGNILCQCIYTF